MPKDFRQDANGKEPRFKKGDLVRVSDHQSMFNNWEGNVEDVEGRSPTGLVVANRVHEWHYTIKCSVVGYATDTRAPSPGGHGVRLPVDVEFRLYVAEGKLKDGMD